MEANTDSVTSLNVRKLIEENTGAAGTSINAEKMNIVLKTSENLMDLPNSFNDIFPPYPMRGPKRGVVLVINNIEFENNGYDRRNGADVDAENLKELFTQMGFEWVYWENQTHKELRNKLRDFTDDSNKTLSEVDSCFVIVMSHGGQNSDIPEDTHIITHDNKEFKASDIKNRFNNSNCKLLRGKPKVIIFQACRGDLLDLAIDMEQVYSYLQIDAGNVQDSLVAETSPIISDMLICYTTSPGCKSFREQFKGAWFIQYFCEIFMNHAYNTDVRDLFGMISAKVSKKRTTENALQIPHIVTILFRPFFLFNLK